MKLAAILAILSQLSSIPLLLAQQPVTGPVAAQHIVSGVLDVYGLLPPNSPTNQIFACYPDVLVIPKISLQTSADGTSVSFACQGLGNLGTPQTMSCPSTVSVVSLPSNSFLGMIYFGVDAYGNFVVGDGAQDGQITTCSGPCTHTNQSSPNPGEYAIASVQVASQGASMVPGFYPTSTIRQMWTGYPQGFPLQNIVTDGTCVVPAGGSLTLTLGVFISATTGQITVSCQ